MQAGLQQIAENFWNLRGEFKIAGLLDIGTHCSLVRLRDGNFVFLDAYSLSSKTKQAVDALTEQGSKLTAIINLHPFHTVHVQALHECYPQAKLYGTQRHLDYCDNLPWQAELIESTALQEQFAEDFEFSIPAGVDFISANPQLHFSSVLAYHKDSKTIHSDDTLMYLKLPGLLNKLRPPRVSFHPTLAKTLEPNAGAAQAFRDWANGLITDWAGAENLCAAHSANLIAVNNDGGSIAQRIQQALDSVEGTLRKHEQKYQ